MRLAACVLLLAVLLVSATPAAAAPYQTGLTRWRALDGGFASWQLDGARMAADGALEGTGEATGPAVPTGFAAVEAIPSWSADAPPGGAVEVELRARVDGEWTRWYGFGIWTPDADRRSAREPADAAGWVATDTLALRQAADALQMRVRLSGGARVRAAGLAYSTAPAAPATASQGNPELWGRALELPRCSQMVYPDGGRVWCSPTSTAMILGYWQPDGLPCAPRVRAAVAGVYDPAYRGHGNWPFNTAYAAAQGLEGYVARFDGLDDAEPWIAAGVPVAFSFAFKVGELPGAPIASTTGHLAVLVGFDAAGNPIVHDPAAPADGASVRRTYPRAALEAAWVGASGGTVYLIYPPEWPTPPL